MEDSEQLAIEANLTSLCESLSPNIQLFLTSLRYKHVLNSDEKNLIESQDTNYAMFLFTMDILKVKNNGWRSIIDYLKESNQLWLAIRLTRTAGDPASETLICLDSFTSSLARYYLRHYGLVRSFGDCIHSLNQVWVSPLVEESIGLNTEVIPYETLLDRIGTSRNHSLIEGDVGTGKTTMVKKLAYDWAVERSSGKCGRFELVLAVPLRCVQRPAESFLEMAIDFFFDQLCYDPSEKLKLISSINQMEDKLLICLDGLDGYRNLTQSPFGLLFAPPFEHSIPKWKFSLPPLGRFRLAITARPYACVSVNPNFFIYRFKIIQPNTDQQNDFILKYCCANKKATGFLLESATKIVNIPKLFVYLFRLVCAGTEMPVNLTNLYERIIAESIREEKRQGNLEEHIQMETWKKSSLVTALSELAFYGIKNEKETFSIEETKKFCVTNDCFSSGFLRVSTADAKHQVTFCHKIVQDFLAALYCRQNLLAYKKLNRDLVTKKRFQQDSLFGQFFEGICSED